MAQGSIGDLGASQYSELLTGPMQDFQVGESKRRYSVHRNLLCHHSEALELELTGDGKKRPEVIDLGDYPVEAFELFLRWIYTGKLDDVSDIFEPHDKYNYAVSNHGLYRLCERFDMPQLKNVAMDQYRRGLFLSDLVPDPDELSQIYRQSPSGSPWRRLMTRIAARQIMDPESDRDVEAYRQCFADNADFAVDLISAIKQGANPTLFDDPTDPEVEDSCSYHDHDGQGAGCHIKGKGKIQQALKTPRLNDLRSSSAPHERSISAPHQALPRLKDPKPPARQARQQQDSGGVGPLRRRITSPAASTIEMSTESVMANPPSPAEQKDQKYRKVTPPEKRTPSPAQPPPPDGHPESSDKTPLDSLPNDPSDSTDKGDLRTGAIADKAKTGPDDTSPRRGLWIPEWARMGTRMAMGRRPQTEWRVPGIMTSKAANSAVNGALEGGKSIDGSGSLDDFSLMSSTSTDPDNESKRNEAIEAKIEGLGISSSTVDPSLFSQTKKSSDDLVASINGTPSPNALRNSDSTADGSDTTSPPATPSPQPRNQNNVTDNSENTPSPHRIPKYKIALASHILSPARTPSS